MRGVCSPTLGPQHMPMRCWSLSAAVQRCMQDGNVLVPDSSHTEQGILCAALLPPIGSTTTPMRCCKLPTATQRCMQVSPSVLVPVSAGRQQCGQMLCEHITTTTNLHACMSWCKCEPRDTVLVQVQLKNSVLVQGWSWLAQPAHPPHRR